MTVVTIYRHLPSVDPSEVLFLGLPRHDDFDDCAAEDAPDILEALRELREV